MTTDSTEESDSAKNDTKKWEEFRVRLEKARDDHDGGWYGRDEIQEAMREANLGGVSPYLVLACDRACETHKKFAKAVVAGSRHVWKILSIDDEVGFTKLLKANLERSGKFEVAAEHEPSKALATICEFKPDLVLLDLIMPDVDGMEILRQILEDEELRKIPVIVLSSLVADVEEGDGGMTKDGVLHLSKPVRLRELVHCVERLLYNGIQKDLPAAQSEWH